MVSASAKSLTLNNVVYNVTTKLSQTTFGAGYRFPLSSDSDAAITLATSSGTGKATVSGVAIEGKVDSTSVGFQYRTRVSPKGEFSLAASYVMPKTGTSEIGYGAEYQHEIGKDLAAYVGYAKAKEVTATTFGVRLFF